MSNAIYYHKKERRIVNVYGRRTNGDYIVEHNSSFPQYDGWERNVKKSDVVKISRRKTGMYDNDTVFFRSTPNGSMIYENDVIEILKGEETINTGIVKHKKGKFYCVISESDEILLESLVSDDSVSVRICGINLNGTIKIF